MLGNPVQIFGKNFPDFGISLGSQFKVLLKKAPVTVAPKDSEGKVGLIYKIDLTFHAKRQRVESSTNLIQLTKVSESR